MINHTSVWSISARRELVLQDKEGYLWVNLTDNNKVKHKCYFHRLLGIQYIPNPNNYPEIDHIDRDRTNNSIVNLRWADKTLQNNNKISNVKLKTEEQQVKRIEDLREYKRKWAEDNRRAKGVAKKEKIKTADEKTYKREKAREYRANHTEEKHQEILAKKNEAYDNETQKEYVNRPEVKERRLAEQTRKRTLVKVFNTLPFAEV
jgi:hypothetical protein